MLRREPRERLDQQILAFVREQTADRNEHRAAACSRRMFSTLRGGLEGLPVNPILEGDEAALAGDRLERAGDGLGDAAEFAVGRVKPAQQPVASHRFCYPVHIEKADPAPPPHGSGPGDQRSLDTVHHADTRPRLSQQRRIAQLQERQQREHHQHLRPCTLTGGNGERKQLMSGEPGAGALKKHGTNGVAVDEGEMLLDAALRLGGEVAGKLVFAAVRAVGSH